MRWEERRYNGIHPERLYTNKKKDHRKREEKRKGDLKEEKKGFGLGLNGRLLY